MKTGKFQLGQMSLREFARIEKNNSDLIVGSIDMPLKAVSSDDLAGIPKEMLDYPIRSITPLALNEFIVWLEKPGVTS